MNMSYTAARDDLVALLPGHVGRLLDVGCATGATAGRLKQRRRVDHVTGIEIDAGLAAAARSTIDELRLGDAGVELERLDVEGARFDAVLCGDVLEHLADPWRALVHLRALCPHGPVIVSLPNVGHWSTGYALFVQKRWPYRERGIHDRTHLRFFARGNLDELFRGAGFTWRLADVHHRLIESPHRINGWVAPLLRTLPMVRDLTAFQFLCVLR